MSKQKRDHDTELHHIVAVLFLIFFAIPTVTYNGWGILNPFQHTPSEVAISLAIWAAILGASIHFGRPIVLIAIDSVRDLADSIDFEPPAPPNRTRPINSDKWLASIAALLAFAALLFEWYITGTFLLAIAVLLRLIARSNERKEANCSNSNC